MHLLIFTHFIVTRYLCVSIIPILKAKKLKLNSMLKGKHLLWQTFNLSLYDFKAHAFSLVSQSPQAPQSAICMVAQYMPSTWLRDFTGVRTTEPSFLFSSSGCSDLALRIPIWKKSVERYSKLSWTEHTKILKSKNYINTKDNTHLFSLLHSRNCDHKHITEKTSSFPNSELSVSSNNWTCFFTLHGK